MPQQTAADFLIGSQDVVFARENPEQPFFFAAIDRHYILESFRSKGEFHLSKNLAAWATAAIEIDGAETVARIEQYAGACIHAPPPPPDQIIRVSAPEGVRDRGLLAPIWVTHSRRRLALAGSVGYPVRV